MEETERTMASEATIEFRRDQVERCRKALRAGSSMRSFCKREDVAPATVRSWAKRLGVELEGDGDAGAKDWQEVELSGADGPAPAAPIEVVMEKATVRVPPGTSEDDLIAVLSLVAAL